MYLIELALKLSPIPLSVQRKELGDAKSLYLSIKEFKSLVKDKSITESTIVFNNLVSNISEYDKYWEVNIKDSWHNQFLN